MNIRRLIMACCAIALLVITAVTAGAIDDIELHRECVQCGMDRKVYGYSRMLVEYADGSQVGLCSLHCAVRELDASKGRAVKALLVADRDSRSLVVADKAVWVMGGNKRGVMTRHPKWAFATEAAASGFVKENGGRVVDWAEAEKAGREGLFKHR